MNVGRMEAEVVRDAILHLAGTLDRTIGGMELENAVALTTFRRSLYYSCQPEEDGRSSFAAVFDCADAGDCYRRSRTIIPQQGLALANHRGFGNSFSAYVAWLITQDAAGEVTGQRAARLPQALPAEETRPTRAPRRRAARG